MKLRTLVEINNICSTQDPVIRERFQNVLRWLVEVDEYSIYKPGFEIMILTGDFSPRITLIVYAGSGDSKGYIAIDLTGNQTWASFKYASYDTCYIEKLNEQAVKNRLVAMIEMRRQEKIALHQRKLSMLSELGD